MRAKRPVPRTVARPYLGACDRSRTFRACITFPEAAIVPMLTIDQRRMARRADEPPLRALVARLMQ